MTAYIPTAIKRHLSALNDSYNPLAAANQPSIAHGKYIYLWGMTYQSYGEITRSSSWYASGTQLKAQALAEMNAVRMGVGAKEFGEMLRTGDERIFAGVGGDVVEGVTKGAGQVLGEGVEGGEKVLKGGKEAGQGVGQAGLHGVEGVAGGVWRGGEAVGRSTGLDGLWGRK
ncbi:hypothetical protein BDD12DRAFT_981909 [Trichophaea hybrida]|nr:hypothetical protein BDD12DRAFT_981909 [Trichophaea hybrida]